LENSSAKLMPPGTISMALYGATIGKLGVMTFPAQQIKRAPTSFPTHDWSSLAAACSGRLTADWREEKTTEWRG
jgi:hypothetical protein